MIKKTALSLLILALNYPLIGRNDCVGIAYKDKDGIGRNNQTKNLTFSGYQECLCSCTSEWTKAGKCKMCNHYHKKNDPKNKS